MKITIIMMTALLIWFVMTAALVVSVTATNKCDYDGFEAARNDESYFHCGESSSSSHPSDPYSETVCLSTTDYNLDIVSSYFNPDALLQREEAYCQIYCDSDPACLGFVTVVVFEQNDATPQQQQQHWIECHISMDTPPQQVYNSNGDAHPETRKCWRKIPESCRDFPLPQIVNAHSQVDPDTSCNTCRMYLVRRFSGG